MLLKNITRRLLQTAKCQQNKNLEKTDKYIKTYNLPRLNKEEIENMSRTITSTEI